MNEIVNNLSFTLSDTLTQMISFIPQLTAGVVILVIGWIVARIIKFVTGRLLNFVKFDEFLVKVGMKEGSSKVWSGIASAVAFWFVFLAFITAAFNVWQLFSLTALLNQLLFYLPNVFAAVVIGFIGFVLANVVYNIVKKATRSGGGSSGRSEVLSRVAQYSLYGFTSLVVLNQLQIASNLIQLLLGGFVAMAALAGGLAFGLGGQETARDILNRYMGGRKDMHPLSVHGRRSSVYASEIRRPRRKKQARSSKQ